MGTGCKGGHGSLWDVVPNARKEDSGEQYHVEISNTFAALEK
jgi:hypothetical protein